MLKWIRDNLGALKRSNRGTAAVEAAAIFPVLITLFISSYQITQWIQADRKAVSTAQAIADLATQVNTVNLAYLDSLVLAANWVMEPTNSGPMAFSIAHITFTTTGTPPSETTTGEVTWYQTRGTTSLLPTATALPSGLLSTDTDVPDTLQFSEAALDRAVGLGVGNGSVVMVEFVSEQPSIFSGFVLDGADYSLRRFAYARPRLVSAVPCTDCP